jgi:phosphonate transport system permease protein
MLARSPFLRTSLAFLGVALVCLVFADIEVVSLDPWGEIGRMAAGFLNPDFLAVEFLGRAMLSTLAFAFLGVAAGSAAGFILAMLFHFAPVRWGCAFLRSVHELFWALILLQVFGLGPLTGILALALPYAGIFAKVFSEILEEADPAPLLAVPAGSGIVSTLFFVRLPDVWVHFKTYTMYRLECGIRSSAVLGFVGLPTLGFHLESAFRQGHYPDVAALLILFCVMIGTLRLWVRPRLLWLYVLVSPFFLGAGAEISLGNLVRFFTVDIIPAPLRDATLDTAGAWSAVGDWASSLLVTQALPGIVSTVILTQIALVGAGALALFLFPLVSDKFFGRFGRMLGHSFLVVLRSIPEYVYAYLFLQFWGPSMLPAIVALVLHNGAIIGHLIGNHTNAMALRPDHARGLNLYGFEILPRIYGQFLAFLFYRWEVIMRETAILGILGIHTLGFYIDSSLADIRLDRAAFLIVVTALLNLSIDVISRRLRSRLRLTTMAVAS